MGKVINIKGRRKTLPRIGTLARVWGPFPFAGYTDPFIGKEGKVAAIEQVEENGEEKTMYILRFELPRGHALLSYFEEELGFSC